ncbi:MAG: 5'-nucleotidase, lipoprotein e(P4) family [bacterium]|nr:5'-nucleotidase, lipoprotein e(P4) family [bacterium]
MKTPLQTSILSAACALMVFTGCGNKSSNKSSNKSLLMSIAWLEKSAEYRALTYQAFNLGKMMIDREAAVKRLKKRAVVVDLDETVLLTTGYQARSVTDGWNYPRGWDDWCSRAVAREVPGAKDFLDYAVSKGFDVFYLSNRKQVLEEVTIKNLIKLKFPQAQKDHLILKTGPSSKQGRFDSIGETHYIALLVGDNLNDFSNVFETKSIEERFSETDKHRNQFGSRFIVLPNPIYGAWERILFTNRGHLSRKEKDRIVTEMLRE